MEEKNLMTTVEAARLLALSKKTLECWRHQRRGPRFIKVGGRAVRYRRRDLENFLAACQVVETTDTVSLSDFK